MMLKTAMHVVVTSVVSCTLAVSLPIRAKSQDLRSGADIEKAETLLAEFVDLDVELPEKYGYVLKLNLLTDPSGNQFYEKRITDNYVRDSSGKCFSLTRTIELADPGDGSIVQGEIMQLFQKGKKCWFRRNTATAHMLEKEPWEVATKQQRNEFRRFDPLGLPTFVLWHVVGETPEEGFVLENFLKYKPLSVASVKGKLVSQWIWRDADPNMGHVQTLVFDKEFPVEYAWSTYKGKWNPEEIRSMKDLADRKGIVQAQIETRWDKKKKVPIEIEGFVGSNSKLIQHVSATVEWRSGRDVLDSELELPSSLIEQQPKESGIGSE